MCSPALTAALTPASWSILPALSICLYAVGAVASTVTPTSATMPASSAGAAASVSSAQAPARSGNTTSIPRPKVNASGAVQATRSSASSRRTARPKVLSIESTSRWKWVVILGTPVLPEVGQNSATSSAAVGTLAEPAGLALGAGGEVVPPARRRRTPRSRAGWRRSRAPCARRPRTGGRPARCSAAPSPRSGPVRGRAAPPAWSRRCRPPSAPRARRRPPTGCSASAAAPGCLEPVRGPRPAPGRSGWPAAGGRRRSRLAVRRAQRGTARRRRSRPGRR